MRNKYKGDDLRSRLGGTVIRYKGTPYLCDVQGEDLVLSDLVSGALVARVSPDDPMIDISSLTLGYFNIGKSAVYVTRHPYRRYKQGVDLGALQYQTLSQRNAYGAADMLRNQGFLDGLNDKFPPLAKALNDIMTNSKDSVAISRDVAITKDKDVFKIHVKGSEEAWMKVGTTRVLVPPNDSAWATVWILKDACSAWEVVEGLK